MNNPWHAILLFALVEIPLLIGSISRAASVQEVRPRPTTATAWQYVGWQLTFVGLIAWAFYAGLINANAIGLRLDAPLKILIYGSLGWVVVQLVSRVLDQYRATEYKLRDFLRFQRAFWPRTRSGRLAMIAFLSLNPFTEEVITRGVLVLMLSAASGSLVVGVGVGLALCLLNHLYQGVRSLPIHAVYFAVTTTLMFTEAGLGAAILCHAFADLSPVYRSRQYLAWIRQERVKRHPRVPM